MWMNLRVVPAIAAVIVSSVSWPAMAKQISLDPDAWDIRFSYDMPEHPAAEGAGWTFSFPSGINCSGNCLMEQRQRQGTCCRKRQLHQKFH
jgi:hypothetical protein